MNNERIDLDAIESEWDKYQSDGPVDDVLASLDISRMIAELKRCYKLLDDADYAMSRYGEEEEHQDIDNVADAYEAVTCALAGLGRYC